MKTGFRGTFVVPWSQTEIDGLGSAPLQSLRVGVAWRWTGEAMRVDGPKGILPLGDAKGEANLRKRAALSVRRLLNSVEADTSKLDEPPVEGPLFDEAFTVTDGRDTWTVTLIDAGMGKTPLCMFHAEIPPRAADLWVVSHNVDLNARQQARGMPGDPAGGVICFTPGTLIQTEQGPLPVEQVGIGTRLQTKDNGLQAVIWQGQRHVSGARLYAMPHLAPVRLNRSSLGVDIPDNSLLVSPDHRIVLRGERARILFNCQEVLVAARDLVNDREIIVDRQVRGVQYIHLMLPQHEIVFANGVETESFHPLSADLASMASDDLTRLNAVLPDFSSDAQSYGGYARRVLAGSEAAILRHQAA